MLVQGPEVLPKHIFIVIQEILDILIPHMLSESEDAAGAHILGRHLGKMLIRLITIANAFLCKKNTFPEFLITKIGHFESHDAVKY